VDDSDDRLLTEQLAYYRARAPEYDRWWYRTHEYALPDGRKAEWDEEVTRLEAAIDALGPFGDLLELACGTGLWTLRLARRATRITAVDGSPEVLALNRSRLAEHGYAVDFVHADLFSWRPPRSYDVIFFSFWLSHIPPERFAEFWSTVARSLRQGGRAIFIDSRWGDETAPEPNRTTAIQTRSLSDGREFNIVKVYYKPGDLGDRLSALGWRHDITASGRSCLYGAAWR
jgi:demethylmenaquinone methyltransferase/2-methoxy-6-polyprenyl-1,4-benzoquinol methylase